MGKSKESNRLIFFIFYGVVGALFFFLIDDANARVYGADLQEEIRIFNFKELSVGLDLRFEYEDDKQQSEGEPFRQKQIRFEERLDIKAQGSIYHPNFLNFNISTSSGLRQESFRGDSNYNANTYPYEYDINLNFFQQKPFSFNLFANRSTDTVSREFFDTMDIDTNLLGGSFRYQNKLFPVSLVLQHQNTKETSDDYKRDRTERTAELKISNKIEDILKSDFSYAYKDLIENNPSRQEVVTHDLRLDSSVDYKQFHGISNISFLKSTGSLATDSLQIDENFYIDHSKTFTTLYNYNFSYFTAENYRSKVNQGSIGFRHKLYKSLTTELKGEVSLTDGTDFREFYYGPRFSVSYNKKVPGGTLSAGYNFQYQRVDRKSETGDIKVFGESIVLTDSQRTFLAHPNVILSSVVVRDTGGVVLVINVDYELITAGTLTEIKRVSLPNNTTVLVDYDYTTPPNLKYDSLTNGFNIRYDFKQLFSLYYSYNNIRQKEISKADLSTTETNPLNNTEKSLYGAELKWRWFNVGAEYEDDNSDLNPYTAFRVRGNFSINLTDYSSFGLSGNHSKTNYEVDRKKLTNNSLTAITNIRLNSFLDAELEAGYLKEKGTDVDTRALKIKGNLKSKFRSIELRLQTEYERRHEITQDRNEFLIKLKLIRYFNII